jgi:hypothetical protein
VILYPPQSIVKGQGGYLTRPLMDAIKRVEYQVRKRNTKRETE